MSHLPISPTLSLRLRPAAHLGLALGLSLAVWLVLGWGLAGAGAPSGIPPLEGPCDATVTNDHDDGDGSLRQAIAVACDGGRITFAADYTIYLTSTLSITKELTVDGETNAITVSGDSGGDGTRDVRVLTIEGSGVATLTHLSIVSGTTPVGYDCPDYCGGGIFIESGGRLTVQNSTLAGNSAGWGGGGVYNWGTLTVQNSTLASNSAIEGGGINNNAGTLTVQNSTLSGNSAVAGGGILNFVTLTVQNSTLAGNSATSHGGGIYNYAGTLALSDTLIAGSLSGGDCYNVGGSLGANDHNLMQSSLVTDTCGLIDGMNGSIVGVDPRLGPLADNGGPSAGFGVSAQPNGSGLTFALLPGSPAIGAGNNATCLDADQRGVHRPQGAVCDIGAFESRGFGLAISGGDHQSTITDTVFAQPLSVTVSSAYGEPVGPGGVISYTAPAAGASLNPAVLTATTGAGGAAVHVIATANSLTGTYTVTVTATGVLTPATFSLTNLPVVRPVFLPVILRH